MKRNIRFIYNGEEIAVTAERDGSTIRIERDSKEYVVTLVNSHNSIIHPANAGLSPVLPKTRPEPVNFSPSPGASAPLPKSLQGDVLAPMTGVVKEILVAVGDTVKEGEKVLIMEAMKMDIDVTAVRGGPVTAVLVKPNDNIKEGQSIIRIGN